MNVYQVIYDELAQTDLDSLPPRNALQIVRKIGRLENGLHGDIKKLKDHDVAYRLRMGDFRILFDVDDGTIIVRRIKNRKEAYD
jgi:mRNA interferase RelE/StbE